MKNSEWIGKTVVVRNSGAGVLFGIVVRKTRGGITLKDGGKVFSWEGALCVEAIASAGITGGRLVPFELQTIRADAGEQVLLATDEAMAKLRAAAR